MLENKTLFISLLYYADNHSDFIILLGFSDGSRFPLDFWGLIWRIIGLSKSAVQETGRRNNEVMAV